MKIGLVLEGGGVRGAYTVGALTWLADHDIHFDYNVGISSGAAYLACFMIDKMSIAKNMSTGYACEPDLVGIRALFRCGYYVDYKRIFDEDLLGKEHMDISPIIDQDMPMEVGAYDLKEGKTIYFKGRELDKHLDIIHGACALPVASAVVEAEGHRLLDGGITKMIPIERAVEQGCNKCLVITTKPKDYVRKPSSKIVCWLMKKMYKECPQVSEDYKIRHINYYKQREIIDHMVSENNAVNIYPSKTVKVSRWKGDAVNCKILYDLGYSDMEERKEEIYQLLGQNNG